MKPNKMVAGGRGYVNATVEMDEKDEMIANGDGGGLTWLSVKHLARIEEPTEG